MKNIFTYIILIIVSITHIFAQQKSTKMETVKNHYTFQLNEKVDRKKITFKNRYGITLCGDLYTPKNSANNSKLPALVLSGPFGAVKEQSSGLYANELASRGFVTLAFDNSFTGESGGEARNVASPDIFTEDFSAAVDYLGLLPNVDRNKIGAMAICGLSGMALTASSSDSRIKAVATASMYDMSRSISKGYADSYTPEQKQKIVDHISQQRWKDAENGKFALGLHETMFDQNGNIVISENGLPKTLPESPHPVLVDFWSYYKTPRGYQERSINSTTAWTATTPMAFFEFSLMTNIEMISPRPIMLIAGENAHSRYYSEDVYKLAKEPKELVIVPNATHCDLYDKTDMIPFDKIETFFKTNLK